MTTSLCDRNNSNGNSAERASRLVLPIATVVFILSISLSISILFYPTSYANVQLLLSGKNSTAADNSKSTEQCTCDATTSNITGHHPRPSDIAATFGLHGDISDCCCTFQTVDRTNLDAVYPLLRRIVATPFFAHFKIDLCSDCDLWHDAPLCMLRDCGVCECERPPEWADAADWMPEGVLDVVDVVDDDDCGHVGDRVVTMVDSHVTDGWTASSSPASEFFDDSPSSTGEDDDTAVVVDLRLNPERYTGYAGQSADKVWTAIHQENCFRHNEDREEDGTGDHNCTLPTEQRVYNRIISGMHSSISLHIAHSYCLEMDPDRIAECKTWGPNSVLAHERVLDHKDRLENLYVVFAIMLRAAQKAGPAIAAAVPTEDPLFSESLSEWTENLLPEISEMVKSCPVTFDETSLFVGEGGDSKRLELKRRFRHLLQIMRCVGCDRCKLWGTLQTLGVGTALRIILDEDESQGTNLSRQEAVALVHTLERFSSALIYAHELRKDE